MERQRQPTSCGRVFLIHEQELRLPVVDNALMNEQMIKLLLLAEHPDIEIRVVPVVSGAQAVMGGEIIMFRFTDGLPLVCLDQGPVTLFLDDTEHVASCDEQLAAMAEAALDRGEPREMLARLASEFDSAEDSRDAIHHLAEEQPDGSCVEVAFAQVEAAIRDSKNPAGPSLSVSPGSWLGSRGGWPPAGVISETPLRRRSLADLSSRAWGSASG